MLVASNISKQFGNPPVKVLHELSFEIKNGEFIALTGRSGSGKSTLLYILSTLDVASSGHLSIDGHDILSLSKEDLHHFRNQQIGYVFQFHFLLPEITALENILMPTAKFGNPEEYRDSALKLMSSFGLAPDKAHRLPRQLSGGEQQRVAIARALIMKPKYLFADEPTGNLDSINAARVMEIFREVNKNLGTTIIMVTHDRDFAQSADRQIHLTDGRITTNGI